MKFPQLAERKIPKTSVTLVLMMALSTSALARPVDDSRALEKLPQLSASGVARDFATANPGVFGAAVAGTVLADPLERGLDVAGGQRPHDRAVGPEPLVHLQHAVARYQRSRLAGTDA